MPGITLKTLVGAKSGALSTLTELIDAMGGDIGIADATGKQLLGGPSGGPSRCQVSLDDATLGWVTGSPAAAGAVASLLTHLAAKESERRALSTEVLHLYR